MREGFRRLAVAIKTLSWVWFGGCVAYLIWEWFTNDYDYVTPLAGRLLMLAPSMLGLGLAWIVEGFAKPDAPPPQRTGDDPETLEGDSFFSFVSRRDRDP